LSARKKKHLTQWEIDRANESARRTRAYVALQSDPEYNRLFEVKDAALRRWNERDAYKKLYTAAQIREASDDAKRAVQAVNEYEDAAIASTR
jgi:hypothetical protein